MSTLTWARGSTLREAAFDGTTETVVPNFMAMLCILAVFIAAFFMQGAAHNLFIPLALAVGFAMIASYVLFDHAGAGTFDLDVADRAALRCRGQFAI